MQQQKLSPIIENQMIMIDSETSHQPYSFYTSTPEDNLISKEQQLQNIQSQQSHEIPSSSHSVYYEGKKKSKKRKMKAKKVQLKKQSSIGLSKNTHKNKSLSNKSTKNLTNNQHHNNNKPQKRPKSQRTLNRFLGKQSQQSNQILQQQQEQQKQIPTFSLTQSEANYLNTLQMFRGYSLQNIHSNENNKPSKTYRSKQLALDQCLEFVKRRSESSSQKNNENVKKKKVYYFKSYFIIKAIVKQLLRQQRIPAYFKKDIDDLIADPLQNYSHQYKDIIQEPISLADIDQMLSGGNIKNVIQFEAVFNMMIVNSRVYHQLKKDDEMLRKTEQLQRMYSKMKSQRLYSRINQYEKSSIKTTSFLQRPKSKKVAIQVEGENREIQFMDLGELINKNRVKVMNYYLRMVCERKKENSGHLHTLINRVKGLIGRYSDDRVRIVNCEQSQRLNEKGFQTLLSLQKKQSVSSTKGANSNNSQKKGQVYELEIECISVSLFQQLKELIRSQWRELKRLENRGQDVDEIYRNELYPHQDSEDFNSDDDDDS